MWLQKHSTVFSKTLKLTVAKEFSVQLLARALVTFSDNCSLGIATLKLIEYIFKIVRIC